MCWFISFFPLSPFSILFALFWYLFFTPPNKSVNFYLFFFFFLFFIFSYLWSPLLFSQNFSASFSIFILFIPSFNFSHTLQPFLSPLLCTLFLFPFVCLIALSFHNIIFFPFILTHNHNRFLVLNFINYQRKICTKWCNKLVFVFFNK